MSKTELKLPGLPAQLCPSVIAHGGQGPKVTSHLRRGKPSLFVTPAWPLVASEFTISGLKSSRMITSRVIIDMHGRNG